MEARNRLLPEWFERVRTRQVQLPRFQRHEVWSPTEVSDLLQAVLRGLPVGAALILEVGDSLPFVSRTLASAPSVGERTTELLLDGQQRLTALWRALNDTYDDRTYFIRAHPLSASNGNTDPELVFGQPRWSKRGKRYPVWADAPPDVWERGLIPLRLLRPGDISGEIDAWTDFVAREDHRLAKEIDRLIQTFRQQISSFNLPFLSLPVSTAREVALDVFLKLNTSSVRLSTFDIIVAQVEATTDQSLHDLLRSLTDEVPTVEAYADPEKLVLDTAALHQDKSPNQTGYWHLDLSRVVASWDRITTSIAGAVGFLEEEMILDAERLPTAAALSVIAGLWPFLPDSADELGRARTLLRKYLWRSCLTARYEQAAATAAFSDFKTLRAALAGGAGSTYVPIFDEKIFPAPTVDEIQTAGWPKSRGILSRGLLGLSLRCGARDIADDTPISRSHITQREYHHLFPVALLRSAGLGESQVFRAVNCALITWRTNRTIGAKPPLEYLRERVQGATLDEAELRRRLWSHVIPYDPLAVGGYSELSEAERAHRIRTDYEGFLEQRAELLSRAIRLVWEGRQMDLPALGQYLPG